jgi:DNA-binding MarR family transcriptional regulator
MKPKTEYKYDMSIRWWKKVAQFDEEIANWSPHKWWLMREILELSVRWGSDFTIDLNDLALRVHLERHYVGRTLKKLDHEGWLTYEKGEHRRKKSRISLRWSKVNELFRRHELEFADDEGLREDAELGTIDSQLNELQTK